MSQADDLRQMQAEGRKKLRELEERRELRHKAAVDSATEARERRISRNRRLRSAGGQVAVQALGTVIGGGALALIGLMVGLIQSTPRAQVISGLTLAAILVTGVAGGLLAGLPSKKMDRLAREMKADIDHAADIRTIASKYRLSEDPPPADPLEVRSEL